MQGRNNDGVVQTYGRLTLHGDHVVASPSEEKHVQFVMQHALFQGPDKPMLQPGTPEWFKMLPLGLSGSRLWCKRAARHA